MPKTTSKTMNQYTQQLTAMQQPASKFDEAAADLTAFLDFSSFDPVASSGPDAADAIALAPLDVSSTAGTDTFAHAFDFSSFKTTATAGGPLRPVDDALLDSPLGLELSPADSIFTASSISGSPYDLEMSLGDFGDSSPLFSTASYSGSPAIAPEVAFPAISASSASASGAAATPGMITTAELPSLFAALPLVAAHELRDIKPIIPTQHLARHESTDSVPFSFDDFVDQTPDAHVVDDAALGAGPQVEASASPAPTSTSTTSTRSSAMKRKSVAEIKRDAERQVAEKEYKADKHLGFRNTKKKMVDYDAPTLPKNYLTESATSKKRAGSSKVAAAVAKRARVSASPAAGSPASAHLPAASATPLDADQLDEDQLTQIELKRRQNTLAARKSRMRKAETFRVLSEEVDQLKQLNDALKAENEALKAKLEAAGLA